MSNSTLPFSALQSAVTDPTQKTMHMPEQDLVREEKQLHLQTHQVLDTIRYSPRTATLTAIFDYAQDAAKDR